MYIFNKTVKLFPSNNNDKRHLGSQRQHQRKNKQKKNSVNQCRSRTIVNQLFTSCSQTKSVKYKQ